MKDYRYAKEKFRQAVYVLVIGQGDVRARLLSAFSKFHPLSAQVDTQIPPELVDDFEDMTSELTKYEPRDERERRNGSVATTLSRIKNSTGSRIAEKIYEFHRNLENY